MRKLGLWLVVWCFVLGMSSHAWAQLDFSKCRSKDGTRAIHNSELQEYEQQLESWSASAVKARKQCEAAKAAGDVDAERKLCWIAEWAEHELIRGAAGYLENLLRGDARHWHGNLERGRCMLMGLFVDADLGELVDVVASMVAKGKPADEVVQELLRVNRLVEKHQVPFESLSKLQRLVEDEDFAAWYEKMRQKWSEQKKALPPELKLVKEKKLNVPLLLKEFKRIEVEGLAKKLALVPRLSRQLSRFREIEGALVLLSPDNASLGACEQAVVKTAEDLLRYALADGLQSHQVKTQDANLDKVAAGVACHCAGNKSCPALPKGLSGITSCDAVISLDFSPTGVVRGTRRFANGDSAPLVVTSEKLPEKCNAKGQQHIDVTLQFLSILASSFTISTEAPVPNKRTRSVSTSYHGGVQLTYGVHKDLKVLPADGVVIEGECAKDFGAALRKMLERPRLANAIGGVLAAEASDSSPKLELELEGEVCKAVLKYPTLDALWIKTTLRGPSSTGWADAGDDTGQMLAQLFLDHPEKANPLSAAWLAGLPYLEDRRPANDAVGWTWAGFDLGLQVSGVGLLGWGIHEHNQGRDPNVKLGVGAGLLGGALLIRLASGIIYALDDTP